MHKRRPILILLSVQLVFVILISVSGSAVDLIIRTFGTEYIFSVEDLVYYGNFKDDMELHCYIKSEIPDDYGHVLANGRYGIIETDNKGLSYISLSTDKKPESGNYIKSKGDGVFYFDPPHMTVHYDIFNLGETSDPPLFIRHNLTTSTEYEITASVYVFKGQVRLKEIYVDGVEIIRFLTNQKETQL